jgi:hypothetical protein
MMVLWLCSISQILLHTHVVIKSHYEPENAHVEVRAQGGGAICHGSVIGRIGEFQPDFNHEDCSTVRG